MDESKKALVVLSGGQDSATCLYFALERGYEVHAISFNYGQRHSIELESARIIGKLAGVKSHEFVELPTDVLKSTSPLVSDEPLEQYADHRSLPGGVEKTFVPMRNQLFLTIAFNRAVCIGAEYIFTGVAQEDYGGYPDCRQTFITWLEQTSNVGLGFSDRNTPTEGYIRIETPLMKLTKKETVELALGLPGCYAALAFSHTSYDGNYPPLGKDHATLLRAKGFEEAGVPDPLVLRAFFEGFMDLPGTSNYTSSEKLRLYGSMVREVIAREDRIFRFEDDGGSWGMSDMGK